MSDAMLEKTKRRKSKFYCGQYLFTMAEAMEMTKQTKRKANAAKTKEVLPDGELRLPSADAP